MTCPCAAGAASAAATPRRYCARRLFGDLARQRWAATRPPSPAPTISTAVIVVLRMAFNAIKHQPGLVGELLVCGHRGADDAGVVEQLGRFDRGGDLE